MKCKDLYHLRLHIGHIQNAGQNFWNIAKKSSKVGKDQKTSKFVFVYILTGIANVFGSGHQANSPLNFDIFLIFLNFITLQVVHQNISHLQQKVFYNRNQVPFYLRQNRPALNIINVRNIMTRIIASSTMWNHVLLLKRFFSCSLYNQFK